MTNNVKVRFGWRGFFEGLAWLAIAIGIGYSCAQPDTVTSWAVETCAEACGDRGIAKVTDAECSCR